MNRPPWNKTQKSIYWITQKEVPTNSALEYVHRLIHRLMDPETPINRLELLERCNAQLTHHTKQDYNRHISDYKRRAIDCGILRVLSPREFIDENPIQDVGINFSPKGGYSLFDESMVELQNFKTNDEAVCYTLEHPDWGKKMIEQGKVVVAGDKSAVIDHSQPDNNISLAEIRQQGAAKFNQPTKTINNFIEQEAEELLSNIEIE